MFDGVACSSVFGGEGTPPEINLLPERLEMLTGGSSFSLHFGPEFSCEIPSSATLTVLLEGATPSVDAFVVGPFVSSTEAKADTFFPAGKASLLLQTANVGGTPWTQMTRAWRPRPSPPRAGTRSPGGEPHPTCGASFRLPSPRLPASRPGPRGDVLSGLPRTDRIRLLGATSTPVRGDRTRDGTTRPPPMGFHEEGSRRVH